MVTKRILVGLLTVICLGTAIFVGFLWGKMGKTKLVAVTDFTSCVRAGYVVTGSQPQQCKTPEGKIYTEKVETKQTKGKNGAPAVIPVLKTREFTSQKGVVIKLYDWAEKPTLSSPVTIKGEVPGNWSFEASFPVVLTDWDGKIIAQEPAKLQGDWMTDQYVPFSVTLTFTSSTQNKSGSLILRKDNPSGLPQNDDAVEIPVTYK